MKCCVPKCPSAGGKGLKFNLLPSGKMDIARREAWILAIYQGHSCSIAKKLYVCEIHFSDGDWERLREDGSKKLKRSAIPSLHLPSKTSTASRRPVGSPKKNLISQFHKTPSSAASPVMQSCHRASPSAKNGSVRHYRMMSKHGFSEHCYAKRKKTASAEGVTFAPENSHSPTVIQPTGSCCSDVVFSSKQLKYRKSSPHKPSSVRSFTLDGNCNICEAVKESSPDSLQCSESQCHSPRIGKRAGSRESVSSVSLSSPELCPTNPRYESSASVSFDRSLAVSNDVSSKAPFIPDSHVSNVQSQFSSQGGSRQENDSRLENVLSLLAKIGHEHKILKEQLISTTYILTKENSYLRHVLRKERRSKGRLLAKLQLTDKSPSETISPYLLLTPCRNSNSREEWDGDGVFLKPWVDARLRKVAPPLVHRTAWNVRMSSEQMKLKSEILHGNLDKLETLIPFKDEPL